MKYYILFLIFCLYIYFNYTKYSREIKFAWIVFLKLNYTKESAASIIAILDTYTNINPKYIDKNLLLENTNFTKVNSYFNQDEQIENTFLDDVPLGINKFASYEQKTFLKNLAKENRLSIFNLQIQLHTLDFFLRDERLYEINNIEEAVDKYIEIFYPDLLEKKNFIINKAHEFYDYFKDKNRESI